MTATPLPPSPFGVHEFLPSPAASSAPPPPPGPRAPGLRYAADIADSEAEHHRARARDLRQQAEEADRAAAVCRGLAVRYRKEAAAEEGAS